MTTSTNDDRENAMRRVRKMLALAADAAASEGERDNAMRMVHAVLAKYNLSLAEAEAAGTATEEQRLKVEEASSSIPWIRTVAQALAHLYFCEYFYIRATAGRQRNYFVGREANANTSREMFQYVLASLRKEAARAARAEGGNGGWERSFCKGAAHIIWRRCRELREAAEKQPAPEPTKATGTAIVLASVYAAERAANDAWLAAQGISLRTARTSQFNTDGNAYHAGRSFGATVSLNRQVAGSGRKALT